MSFTRASKSTSSSGRQDGKRKTRLKVICCRECRFTSIWESNVIGIFFPFNFAIVIKSDSLGRPIIVPFLFGEQYNETLTLLCVLILLLVLFIGKM